MSNSYPDLVSTSEAAEMLKITPKTISRYAQDGRLRPATKLPGLTGAYLFNRTDIEALAEFKSAV